MTRRGGWSGGVGSCVCVLTRSVGKALEMSKQRPQKQLSQPALSVAEQSDSSPGAGSGLGGRPRGSQSSDSSDTTHVGAATTSPPHSAPAAQSSDGSGRDTDSGEQQSPIQPPPTVTLSIPFSPSLSVSLSRSLSLSVSLPFSLSLSLSHYPCFLLFSFPLRCCCPLVLFSLS